MPGGPGRQPVEGRGESGAPDRDTVRDGPPVDRDPGLQPRAAVGVRGRPASATVVAPRGHLCHGAGRAVVRRWRQHVESGRTR